MARELDFVDECYADKDLSLLKKLTLVIPTYNRNYYLSRCLWYHAHFPFGQIIVADSSPEEKKVVNRETVAKIREMFGANVLYLEYQPETEKYGGDIYRKWGDAVQHVETEYSEICTDKEFVIPTVCQNGIQYLDENSDYICAFGNRLEFIKSLTLKKLVAPVCIQTYDELSGIDRLNKLSRTQSIPENLFQLYRTNIHKILYQNIDNNQIHDIRYGEIALELQPLLLGKIKQFDEAGRVRDLLSSTTGKLQKINKSESSSIRYIQFSDYPADKQKELHKRLIQCLSETINHSEKISPTEQIRKPTDKVICWWMKPRNNKFSNRLKYYISKQLPDNIRKIMSRVIDRRIYTYTPKISRKDNKLNIIKKIILENITNQNSEEILLH